MEKWSVKKIELDEDKNESAWALFKEYTMDESGNVLDETEYYDDGNVACKRIYRYFDNGAVSQYVMFDPLDQLLERHTYSESEPGCVDKVLYEYSGGKKIEKQFRYSDLGFSDKAVLTDENGAVIGYETFVLDEEGNVLEEIELAEDHTVVSRTVKKYNQEGLLLRETKNEGGKVVSEVVYDYNQIGDILKKTTVTPVHHSEVVDHYEYDASGNQVRNTTIHNGVLVFDNQCTYDDQSNLLTEEFFELDYWERRVLRHEKLIHTRIE